MLTGDDPVGRLMRSPLGALVARPWFDRVALRFIARRFLPLSRAWAAATIAEGSVERFLAEVPLADPGPRLHRRLAPVLDRVARLKSAAQAAEARWGDAAFGPGAADGERLDAVAADRLAATHALMATRAHFAFLLRRYAVPPARYAIIAPDAVEARYADILAAPERAYAMPSPLPEVVESGRITGADATRYWLRFPSPSETMADTVHARVFEPVGVADPPTLIFGHGLFMEAEQWRGMPDAARPLCRLGVRVVEPESPWHGRRMLPGRYGGEPFIAAAPTGAFDLFAAQARETAALIAWCRRAGSGPVAVGGLSLGALVGQVVGVHCRRWPSAMRPDALLLVTACDRIDELALRGVLGRALGLDRALRAHGWSAEALARLRPLTDPLGAPAVAPEDVVVVLGSHDDVTPFALGRALFERWGVPRENLFVRRQGHFSAALGLLRDTAHLVRLCDVLARREGSGGALGRRVNR